MDHPKTNWTEISLCAGYAGLSIALEGAGFNISQSIYVEVEAFVCQNLVKKIEEGRIPKGVIYTDVKTFPFICFREVPNLIITGGIPCQPFSCAGQRKADEDPRHLLPYVLKGIEDCQPDIVMLENVEGMLSSKLKGDHWADPEGTPVLLHILRELERRGYQCSWELVSASEVGAPHRRKRVFVMAYRSIKGLEGLSRNVQSEGRQPTGKNRPATQSSLPLWPARPGEQQHDWEEPRVI